MEFDLEASASETIKAAGFNIGEEVPFAILNPDAIAAAVVDIDGNLHAETSNFFALNIRHLIDDDIVLKVAAGAEPVIETCEADGLDGAKETILLAYASTRIAKHWRLPISMKNACNSSQTNVVVLTTVMLPKQGPIEFACRAYGLTGLQTKVLVETLMTGSIRQAAIRLGIAYQTAREAVSYARSRIGESRLPALIHRVASLAFGILPDDDWAAALIDLWGLSARQAALATLVAQGISRSDAASRLKIGEAIAMKELGQVFELLQVSSVAGLARKIAETRALRVVIEATNGDVGYLDPTAEPLLFVRRPDGTRVAVSDYGPPTGRPVLVVHSTMMSRIVGRRLLRALHDAGFRPISIDRPGFGLTDEVPGMKAGAHNPYATAVDDTLLVLNKLKIKTIDVVARGVAQFVIALQAAAPLGMIKGVVVINPALNNQGNSRKSGPYGVFKEAYRRNPATIRLSAALLMRGLTYERTARMLQSYMAGSKPDEEAIEDADIIRDFYRAQRMFALGKYAGFVNEQIEYVRASPIPPQSGLNHWQILIAQNDTLHDPDQVFSYWSDVLPHAEFARFTEGGRLMALSHPHLVLNALANSIKSLESDRHLELGSKQ